MGREFEGRVAVITGAGQGIGAATARLFADRGASVALVDRAEKAAADQAASIAEAGGNAIGVVADVADPAQVEAAVDRIGAELGGVDILIANHTVHPCGPVLDTDPVEWDLTLSINVTGTFLMARAVLPSMIERGGGVLVGLGSDCVVRSCRGAAAYVASKAAIGSLMRSIAVDYGDRNIRANVVIPGVTRTPGLQEAYSTGRDLEESLERAAGQSILGRIGEPIDVAEMIAFVCSDRAAFVTGAEIPVDGGMTVSYSGD